jgi:hypothetical protein
MTSNDASPRNCLQEIGIGETYRLVEVFRPVDTRLRKRRKEEDSRAQETFCETTTTFTTFAEPNTTVDVYQTVLAEGYGHLENKQARFACSTTYCWKRVIFSCRLWQRIGGSLLPPTGACVMTGLRLLVPAEPPGIVNLDSMDSSR